MNKPIEYNRIEGAEIACQCPWFESEWSHLTLFPLYHKGYSRSPNGSVTNNVTNKVTKALQIGKEAS